MNIKAISGPLKGKEWTLKEGLSIGRNKGDIVLVDPKVSGQHAAVRLMPDGSWLLLDKGSKNGIRQNGSRVDQVALKPGIRFQIGASTFEIEDPDLASPPEFPEITNPGLEPVSKENELPSVIAQAAAAPPPPIPATPKEEPETSQHWSEVIGDFLEETATEAQESGADLSPFFPAIRLTFVRGLQVETQWFLGYGPRRAGARSLDLPIFEPGAPDICFEIAPGSKGPRFSTSHPEKVSVNGQAIPSRVLNKGDVIRIAGTEIEVDFL